MVSLMMIVIGIAAYLMYLNKKLTNENEKLKRELKRTMDLVESATQQGFKL